MTTGLPALVWCAVHRDVHPERPSCREAETDEAYTARLIAAATEQDRRVTYSPEAAYVAEHRPY